MDINNVVLCGRLTDDPTLNYVGENKTPKVEFKLANSSGSEKYERKLFIDVIVWGTQAENCKKYLVKGQEVSVVGEIGFDQWEYEEKTYSKYFIRANNVVFGRKPKKSAEVEESETPEEAVPF